MNDIIEMLGRTEGSGDGVVAVFDRHDIGFTVSGSCDVGHPVS